MGICAHSPKHPANTGNEGIMNNYYPLIRLGIAPHLQHIPHLSWWSHTAAPEWSTCLILELALPSSLQPHWQSSWVVGRKPPVTQVSPFHKVGYRFPLIHVSPPFVCVKGDDETSKGTGTFFAKKHSDSGGFHSYCCWITIKADSPYLCESFQKESVPMRILSLNIPTIQKWYPFSFLPCFRRTLP